MFLDLKIDAFVLSWDLKIVFLQSTEGK